MELRVRDLMTTNLVSIDAEDSVMEAARLMNEQRISSVIVKHEKEISGMITDRDIIAKVVSRGLDPRKVKASEVMRSPLITISEEATIEEAARKMRENSIRRLVVERDRQKVGMIAESDIVRITPELYFLIRERSRLEARVAPEPREVLLGGICEKCENYSGELRKVDGMWLCENCGW